MRSHFRNEASVAILRGGPQILAYKANKLIQGCVYGVGSSTAHTCVSVMPSSWTLVRGEQQSSMPAISGNDALMRDPAT